MATFVPAVNVAEIAMSFTDVTGDENINKFDVLRSSPWTNTTLLAMMNAFTSWFTTGDGTHTYQKVVSSGCNLVAIKGRDLTTQHGISLVSNTGLPQAGLGSATAVAAGTTKAVTHRTGLAGKSFRGRTFLCAIPSGAVPSPQSGLIVASFMTDVISAFTSLITAVSTADAACSLVVLSRYYQPGGPNTPTVPRATGVMTPITSMGYSTLNVDFQRRRAPGHARHR